VLQQISSQLQKEVQNQSLVIFTDGLWVPEKGAGSAAVTHPRGESIATTLHPADSISNFEAELIGIRLAIIIILAKRILEADLSNNFTKVAIFSDNQGALMRSSDPISLSSGQNVFTDNFFQMKLLGRPIRLFWCPGHKGIEANKKADSLAKKAAVGEDLPSDCMCQTAWQNLP
jgi:ribonuclease HI